MVIIVIPSFTRVLFFLNTHIIYLICFQSNISYLPLPDQNRPLYHSLSFQSLGDSVGKPWLLAEKREDPSENYWCLKSNVPPIYFLIFAERYFCVGRQCFHILAWWEQYRLILIWFCMAAEDYKLWESNLQKYCRTRKVIF